MVEGAKNLKVSLGAFSCEAAGYDDPLAAVREAAVVLGELIARDPTFAVAAIGRELPSAATRAPELGDGASPSEALRDALPDEADDARARLASAPESLGARPPREDDALARAIARIAGRVGSEDGEDGDRGEGDGDEAKEEDDDRRGSEAVADDAQSRGTGEADMAAASADGPGDEEMAENRGAALDPESAAAPRRSGVAEDRPDDSVERLIGTARDRMAEPETSRRLTALRRLRQAARATEADRDGAVTEAEGDRDGERGAYGDDLDRAIHRDGGSGEGETPAPLVLVSSQRIDLDAGAVEDAMHAAPQIGLVADRPDEGAADPVDARGPADEGADAVAPTTVPEDVDLRALWKERSAEGLEDRMAIVAEILSIGRDGVGDGFSRPDLMTALEAADPDGFAGREERLRAFGELVKHGRVERVGRGVYAAPSGDDAERA